MKKLAVTLVTLFLANVSIGQDFSRFQSFEENAKGKEVIKLKKGKWQLEDCLSEANFHVRNFTYIGDSISEKVSIMVNHHNLYKLEESMVDHVGAVLLDEEMQKFHGHNHLFLYRKGNMNEKVYAVIWLTPDGKELYFELEG